MVTKKYMNKIKVIRTEEDHKAALLYIKELLNMDPDPNSQEGETLNLLTTLVEDYESNLFPESLPDPVEAILFRMEQQGLKPQDLVPYIGSSSKVSEVLSRKRPLSVSMMRALEKGLGIPARVLLKESNEFESADNVAWARFPVREMEKRGYFGSVKATAQNMKTLIEEFLKHNGNPAYAVGLLRKTNYVRSTRQMDKYALLAWSTQVIKESKKMRNRVKFKSGTIDFAFMQKVARFSVGENGPREVQTFLRQQGITLVIEPHFAKTYLDGAAFIADREHPIIGLTLRYDRLDNFWFTLMHELAHVGLHYDQDVNLFYDDLDRPDRTSQQEHEADTFAEEGLIPKQKWESSPARLIPSPVAAEGLARELGVHTSIVAGIMRYKGQRYQYLNTIVNQAKVRKYFPDKKWPK